MLAVLEDWHIHQMDIKSAFLNGMLDEEIYMEQPQGFIVTGMENKVCKLKKSIYCMVPTSLLHMELAIPWIPSGTQP